MSETLFQLHDCDIAGKRTLIPISGGINSAAVLVWTLENKHTIGSPSELHLFHSDFDEHSDDTLKFVQDLFCFAINRHPKVKCTVQHNNLLDYFRGEAMIPHPMFSPCSRTLKLEPVFKYKLENSIEVELLGFVKTERKRMLRAQANATSASECKLFPLISMTEEYCFQLVKKHIGWWPKIYDIKDHQGNRAFRHNNCLPCKNMDPKYLKLVELHYPEKWKKAQQLAEDLQSHWGRTQKVATVEGPGFTLWGAEDVPEELVCPHCIDE